MRETSLFVLGSNPTRALVLRRLTLADVDTYVLEKDLDIVKETKRALYSMANLRLKTGK